MVEIIHRPVLCDEVLEYLAPKHDDAVLLDATVGEGGHADAFLSRFPHLRYIGLDADPSILHVAEERLQIYGTRVQLLNVWFNSFLGSYPADFPAPDLILMDLGISVFHYERSGRGFSFGKNELLDMRLDPHLETSAFDIVNEYPEYELASLISRYSDERYARRIARALIEARSEDPIRTSLQLAEVVFACVPAEYRHGRIHPATRTFQALRIAVNGELVRLTNGLESAIDLLPLGGRIGVISFHSLEDRIVKDIFREKNKTCTCPPEWPICKCDGVRELEILTKKPIRPSGGEVQGNAPSRSSRLRVAEKVAEGRGKV